MTPVWNVEKGNTAYVLILKDSIIEFSMYEIPATSYTSGGMNSYAVQEFYENSELWKTVVYYFGENIAEEILQKIQTAGYSAMTINNDNAPRST